MQPTIYYCYDAWCGWCYGFSPVIKRLWEEYKESIFFEVLSGGMMLPDEPRPFGPVARYVQTAYKRVEELTGIRFGQDFLWHVFHPDETDWAPHSLKPAIALCVFKEYLPDKAVAIASDLQYALNFEGRDLTDDEAYRHLVIRYGIPEEEFYTKLHSETYKEAAKHEFALVKQLQVSGFPAVLLQTGEAKFYLLANGYVDYETLKGRLEKILSEERT